MDPAPRAESEYSVGDCVLIRVGDEESGSISYMHCMIIETDLLLSKSPAVRIHYVFDATDETVMRSPDFYRPKLECIMASSTEIKPSQIFILDESCHEVIYTDAISRHVPIVFTIDEFLSHRVDNDPPLLLALREYVPDKEQPDIRWLARYDAKRHRKRKQRVLANSGVFEINANKKEVRKRSDLDSDDEKDDSKQSLTARARELVAVMNGKRKRDDDESQDAPPSKKAKKAKSDEEVLFKFCFVSVFVCGFIFECALCIVHEQSREDIGLKARQR